VQVKNMKLLESCVWMRHRRPALSRQDKNMRKFPAIFTSSQTWRNLSQRKILAASCTCRIGEQSLK